MDIAYNAKVVHTQDRRISARITVSSRRRFELADILSPSQGKSPGNQSHWRRKGARRVWPSGNDQFPRETRIFSRTKYDSKCESFVRLLEKSDSDMGSLNSGKFNETPHDGVLFEIEGKYWNIRQLCSSMAICRLIRKIQTKMNRIWCQIIQQTFRPGPQYVTRDFMHQGARLGNTAMRGFWDRERIRGSAYSGTHGREGLTMKWVIRVSR